MVNDSLGWLQATGMMASRMENTTGQWLVGWFVGFMMENNDGQPMVGWVVNDS